MYEEAIEELDKAAAINPNYSEVYKERGRLYYVFLNDNVLSLFNYHKAAELIHGKELPVILRTIGANSGGNRLQ
jgi:tetratricopeptide (TPR) repeat protein